MVTGASQGIGKAIATAPAAEGAKVVVNDINLDKAEAIARQIREMGQNAIAVQADVSKAAEVNQLAEATLKGFGTIDILVNNAGVLRTTRLEEIT